jgi:hypothetical protein
MTPIFWLLQAPDLGSPSKPQARNTTGSSVQPTRNISAAQGYRARELGQRFGIS